MEQLTSPRFRGGGMLLGAVAAAALVVAVGAWFATRIPASPFDGTGPARLSEPSDRGEYVARLADCVACHTTERGQPFAGGLPMGTPIGTIFSTNITPDRETGIGNYTLAQFDNAVRRGVAADGRRLYPAMPHPSYAKMTDADVEALYDFFQRQVQPVRQVNLPSTIPAVLNWRWPLAFWNLAFANGPVYRADPARLTAWNRGAYLVQGPGHCGSCHTPRGIAMQEVALTERDDRYLSGALLDGWYAPSLRGDHNTGLGRWSEEDIVVYLKTGRNRHGVVFGSMTDAFNNSTQFMSNSDLGAIATYLKSLPGDAARDGAPWKYETSPATAKGAGVPLTLGVATYNARCATCHGSDGLGRGQWIPPLAGVSSVLAPENASAINITLNGSPRVVAGGVPDTYRMPAFRGQMTDREAAEVLSYVRSAWGNKASPVTAEQVKALRDHTNPASPDPIVLQMR